MDGNHLLSRVLYGFILGWRHLIILKHTDLDNSLTGRTDFISEQLRFSRRRRNSSMILELRLFWLFLFTNVQILEGLHAQAVISKVK